MTVTLCPFRFGPTRAGQAACILLHSMWSHSELHRAYRKVRPLHSITSNDKKHLVW